jgi:aminomethyltransferase
MVPFAGHEMPVQYRSGIIAEHQHTRRAAGLFDVSHMGQALVVGPDHRATAAALEKLVPGDILGLSEGRLRYTQLTNPQGGLIDDLMVGRAPGREGTLALVVNASRKVVDFDWIGQNLPPGIGLEKQEDRALIALQGPQAAQVLAKYSSAPSELAFMSVASTTLAGIDCVLARAGYTGEDGFEISSRADDVVALVELLLANPSVQPVGLGARDSLRLEAGLCLYGQDIDETTSPIEAGLGWSIGKRRRAEGGFPGYRRILAEIANGPSRRRVGIKPEGRGLARAGTIIQATQKEPIGVVTSGGFGPTVNGPIAMGYVVAAHASIDTRVDLMLRDRPVGAVVVGLPFVPHAYKR